MNKRAAHYFISAIDAISIACLYWLFTHYSLLKEQLRTEEKVEYFNGIPYLLLTLIIPFIHFLAIIESKYQLTAKALSTLNKLLIVIFLLLIVCCFQFNKIILLDIKNSGFVFCPEQSRHLNISEIKVFFKDNSTCTKD